MGRATAGAPRESVIVERVLAYLRDLPETWAQKTHGGPFVHAGTPDILGSHQGRALALEVKRPGRGATKLQGVMLARWRQAGAIAGVVTGVEDVRKLLEGVCHGDAVRAE